MFNAVVMEHSVYILYFDIKRERLQSRGVRHNWGKTMEMHLKGMGAEKDIAYTVYTITE